MSVFEKTVRGAHTPRDAGANGVRPVVGPKSLRPGPSAARHYTNRRGMAVPAMQENTGGTPVPRRVFVLGRHSDSRVDTKGSLR